MDKTKKIISQLLLVIWILLFPSTFYGQNITEINFCDRKYEYKVGKDSITLFFNVLDKYGNRQQDVSIDQLEDYLDIKEDGVVIPIDKRSITAVVSGKRIPSEYTFSVLIDLSIPQGGKEQIYNIVGKLIESAPDSCVYLSFFGNNVTNSELVNVENYKSLKHKFTESSENKYFYSGIFSKLYEFSDEYSDLVSLIKAQEGYQKNHEIKNRAKVNKDKNILFVFTEGSKRPSDEDLSFVEITEYIESAQMLPKVFALYYTEEGDELNIKKTLEGICTPRNVNGVEITEKKGKYLASNDMHQVLRNFEEVVNEASYDYAYRYKVGKDKIYSRRVNYSAEWKGTDIGSAEFSIGTAENPWPLREEETIDIVLKYLYAILIMFGTIAFFFIIAKIIVPLIRSKIFASKYYKKYVVEPNISRRICPYCKQDIQPGAKIVAKCKHIMHLSCWIQNGYKCAEYGQNCKDGIQKHIDWKDLFTINSLKDCSQTISGIVAGFISWIIYEFFGRGFFDGLSELIVNMCYGKDAGISTLYVDCLNKTSAFLTIGLLLGFFLSLIFRYNDEYKKKDLKIWTKIIGLSLLTGIIGLVAFAIGACILCVLLSVLDITYIPWYCSFPAYLMFSISVSLALIIKSTIPVKSALLGGLCSAIIGFIVLYCSSRATHTNGWMNLLLDFIIYGGGLGASLVTVRMLAEKYFLIIQNGVRAGQKIPIHKWMNAGNMVSIGMTGECEIQMNWEKSNKVAKIHVQLFIDQDRQLPMIKPLATGVIYNNRAELPVGKSSVLSNGDTFKIGDTIFLYKENE